MSQVQNIPFRGYVVIKLKTGEEIVSKVQNADSVTAILENPALIYNDGQKFGLIPWAPFNEDNVLQLVRDHVIAHGNVGEQLLQDYKKNFEPNAIYTPSEKKLILPSQ